MVASADSTDSLDSSAVRSSVVRWEVLTSRIRRSSGARLMVEAKSPTASFCSVHTCSKRASKVACTSSWGPATHASSGDGGDDWSGLGGKTSNTFFTENGCRNGTRNSGGVRTSGALQTGRMEDGLGGVVDVMHNLLVTDVRTPCRSAHLSMKYADEPPPVHVSLSIEKLLCVKARVCSPIERRRRTTGAGQNSLARLLLI